MITASVGRGGRNVPNDVRILQCGLNVTRASSGLRPIAIDGLVGPETLGAIREFQRRNNLLMDGRMDVNGPAITRLRGMVGSEAAIFAPIVAQLLPLRDKLQMLAIQSTGDSSLFANGLAAKLQPLGKFRDLARGLPRQSSVASFASAGRGEDVIGIAGVDDAVAAILAMGFFLAVVVILMVSSPAFQRAVEARAKELDRLLGELKISMQVKFQDAVKLVVSIANETIDARNQCRKSPTFTPSPECEDALLRFGQIADRIRAQVRDIGVLIGIFLAGSGGQFDVREVRRQIEALLLRMQQNAVDLQVELGNLRDKCKCPEI